MLKSQRNPPAIGDDEADAAFPVTFRVIVGAMLGVLLLSAPADGLPRPSLRARSLRREWSRSIRT